MSRLGITICGEVFSHLVYHFVLTYSNWETGSICFSESFESLSTGLQNALWELGGVPATHRSDRLSAAVQTPRKDGVADFTERYQALLRYYGVNGQKIQTGKANEIGSRTPLSSLCCFGANSAPLIRIPKKFGGEQKS